MALTHTEPTPSDGADQTIARSIEAWMAYKRLHQADVARSAGLTQPQLSRRLRGHTEFKASEVAAIAAHLGVKVGDLYDGLSRSGWNPLNAVGLPLDPRMPLFTDDFTTYNATPSLAAAS